VLYERKGTLTPAAGVEGAGVQARGRGSLIGAGSRSACLTARAAIARTGSRRGSSTCTSVRPSETESCGTADDATGGRHRHREDQEKRRRERRREVAVPLPTALEALSATGDDAAGGAPGGPEYARAQAPAPNTGGIAAARVDAAGIESAAPRLAREGVGQK